MGTLVQPPSVKRLCHILLKAPSIRTLESHPKGWCDARRILSESSIEAMAKQRVCAWLLSEGPVTKGLLLHKKYNSNKGDG